MVTFIFLFLVNVILILNSQITPLPMWHVAIFMGTFFTLKVNKKLGISLVELNKLKG